MTLLYNLKAFRIYVHSPETALGTFEWAVLTFTIMMLREGAAPSSAYLHYYDA